MFKLLKNLGKKEIFLIFICFILVCVQVWLELRLPEYMSEITLLVETSGSRMEDILQNGINMIICAIISLVTAIIVGYLCTDISARLSMNIRKKLFQKVSELSVHDIKKFSTNSLITRTTNDITQIQMLVSMGLLLMLKAPITGILVIYEILMQSWQWSIITIICMMIMVCVVVAIVLIVIPKFKRLQNLTDNMNGKIRENLDGLRTVKAFDAENYQIKRFENVNDELTDFQLSNQKSLAIKTPIMYLMMYLLVLAIYYFGAILIKNAFMVEKLALFGDMIVFSTYAMQVVGVFLMLSNILGILPRTEVSASRINEVLDTENKIKNGKIDKDLFNKKGIIEFKNVYFKYPNSKEYILKDASFKINQGEIVSVTGATGSGKTSLIDLILRFYDTNRGKVLIDGISVKDYKDEFLYSKIGYVPQKAVVFNDTIKNNILYGLKNSKNHKIDDVISIIQSENNNDLLNKKISENGNNLSGGQKQKISIARALVRKPEIYIFDDSFSGLNFGNDFEIIQRLKKYDEDATILIITRNKSIIKNSDKVIILDKNRLQLKQKGDL